MNTLNKQSLDVQIEDHRQWWAKIAEENGWYSQPFFVQVWVDDEGEITDSVSYKGLNRDFVLEA